MVLPTIGLVSDKSLRRKPHLRTAAREIDQWDLSFIFERLRAEHLVDEQYFGEAERELKRFFPLIAIERRPLAIIGKIVDEVWHQFVLFTPQYHDFCRHVFRQRLEHVPDSSVTPVPRYAGRNFARGYRRCFGEIPELWFVGMPIDLAQYYRHPSPKGLPRKWSSVGCLASDLPKRLQSQYH